MLSVKLILCKLLIIQTAILSHVASAPKGSSDNPDVEAMNSYFLRNVPGFARTAFPAAGLASSESALLDLALEDNPIFRDSVVNFQRMANIKPTGVVNDETLEKIGESRCGVPDFTSDPNEPGKYEVQSKWHSKKNHKNGLYTMTYTFPKRDTPNDLKFQTFRRGITLAMCSWELISNVRFKNLGLGKKNADIVISYERRSHGDGYSFDGRGGTLGHAFYPEDGRVHLDTDEQWYLAKPGKENRSKKDVYTAALHEFGHTLGLLHSKESQAIMEPFYRYRGSFGTFEMPEDEISGVEDMYGKRIVSNPADEKFSACREARTRYKIKINPPKRTASPTTAVLEEFEEEPCEDDPVHATTHCPAWKARKLCEVDIFATTMHKRCKKTCGFCLESKKAEKTSSPGSIATSICEISAFDSMMTTYDEEDGFSALIFKDDYYFKMEVALVTKKYLTHSLLNDTKSMSGAYKFDTDPRSIYPGLFKIQTPNFMHKTAKAQASVFVGNRYFTFEGQQMHLYKKDVGGVINFETTYNVINIFPGFDAPQVDAVHASVNQDEDKVIYTLFSGSRMWQYQEFRDRGHDNLLLSPVADKLNVDISEWHGVSACDIDAVFEYRGVPYFLKGNVFWPATNTEPPVARDITYNFFRCWQREPEVKIPEKCKSNSGNAAAGQHLTSTLAVFILTLVNHLLIKLFL